MPILHNKTFNDKPITLMNVTLNERKDGSAVGNRNMDGSIQYGMHGDISMVYILEYNHKMLETEHNEYTKETQEKIDEA